MKITEKDINNFNKFMDNQQLTMSAKQLRQIIAHEKEKDEWSKMQVELINMLSEKCRETNMAYNILMDCVNQDKLKECLAELQQFRCDKLTKDIEKRLEDKTCKK